MSMLGGFFFVAWVEIIYTKRMSAGV